MSKKNSTSGTTPIQDNKRQLLSTKEVCRIIKLGKKAGLSELKFGELHVSFKSPIEQVAKATMRQPRIPSVPVKAPTENTQKEALAQDELRLREDQLAMALIEDPVRYEQLLRDGELSDELDTGADGDDN